MFADKRKPAPDGTGSAISLISAQAHQQIHVPACGSVLGWGIGLGDPRVSRASRILPSVGLPMSWP